MPAKTRTSNTPSRPTNPPEGATTDPTADPMSRLLLWHGTMSAGLEHLYRMAEGLRAELDHNPELARLIDQKRVADVTHALDRLTCDLPTCAPKLFGDAADVCRF